MTAYPTARMIGDAEVLLRGGRSAIVAPKPLLAPRSSRELLEIRWPAFGIGVVFGNQPASGVAGQESSAG